MSARTLLTADLPGTGGSIKAVASDFEVEELPLYAACGAGEHIYVRHRRAGFTTREVVAALARAFGVRDRDVGTAGQKDKIAVATQTFSLHLPKMPLDEACSRLADVAGEALEVTRHANKLRTGHALGNRFTILVRGVVDDAEARARAIAARLDAHGVPNFFGSQRYGGGGRNVRVGRELLMHPKRGFAARFQLSAWQSSLFDAWLEDRIARGAFATVVAGDVAKKHDNGALFDVEDEAVDAARAARNEISATGPMFGASMRRAKGVEAEIEDALLASHEVTVEDLSRAELEGTRRSARVFPRNWTFATEPEGLRIGFDLGKGSYATVVLAEITKSDVHGAALPADD